MQSIVYMYMLEGVECISTYHRITAACKQLTTISGSVVHRVTVRARQFGTEMIFVSISNITHQCRCLDRDA